MEYGDTGDQTKNPNKSGIYHKNCLLSMVLIAGCAVLKIDVDVYKGPLANHEHVQMQQMAVMAIGAKPLLIQLRDQLELQHRGYVKEKIEKDGKKGVQVKRKPKWMEPNFIKPPPDVFSGQRQSVVTTDTALK